MKRIAVLLPVLNEAGNIAPLIDRLQVALTAYNATIVIIDDGSTDGTIEKIQHAQKSGSINLILLQRIKSAPGCKRGEALVYGLRYSMKEVKPEIIIELDGDLSHQPEDLPAGVSLLQAGNDVVLGSKYLSTSKIMGRSFFRNTISYFNSALLRILMGTSITDYSNGLRIYNQKAADTILAAQIEYGSPIYLAEAIMLWKLKKLKIAEFPITYIGRKNGSSKVIFGDIFEGLRGAINIARRYQKLKKN